MFSDGHDKPSCTEATMIIDNFKKALSNNDNRKFSISESDIGTVIDKLSRINFSDKPCGKSSMCLTKFFVREIAKMFFWIFWQNIAVHGL